MNPRELERDLQTAEAYLDFSGDMVLPKPCGRLRPRAEGELPDILPPYRPRWDPAPAEPPVVEEDAFDAGRAAVDSGAVPAPAAPIKAAELTGTWLADGYYCDGAQGTEIVMIHTSGANGLVATKVTGDACIPAGLVTWTGTLQGNTIVAQHHVSDNDGSNRRWIKVALTVMSRKEINGFGVTFRRRP